MSSNSLYRLGNSTAVEPLVNKWAAWSHVVSPVPYSLHLLHYQLKLMQSYLDDPSLHVDACRNPKLRSGRFVNVPEERADEVMHLMQATIANQSDNLRFAECITEFHNFLVQEAKGQSLDPFYEMAPPLLRGYIELMYDYYNRPTVRFFESLLYESPYYHKNIQSLRLFRHTHDNERLFVMSTPRLDESDQIDWRVPFESAAVDNLFKLDCAPKPLDYIREVLELSESHDPALLPLLATDPVPQYERWDGPDVRVRYFGHACALIEWNGVSILTDPYIGVTPSRDGVERFSYSDLPPRIDYVLITHNHHDHFCLESLLRLRHRIGCLVVPRSFGFFYGDLSLKVLAVKAGFRNVVEMDSLDAIELPGMEIIAVPFMGEHADLPHSKTAYVVRAGAEQILFAADSDCLDQQMYGHIRRLLGPITTVFLGMECVGAPLSWSCGPFFPVKPDPGHEKSRRYKGCDSARAMRLLEEVGANRIYVYAMGMEPWFEHLLGLAYTENARQIVESNKLIAKAREMGFIEAKRLFGKYDVHLSSQGSKDHVFYDSLGKTYEKPRAVPTNNGGGTGAAPAIEITQDIEDHFTFD